MKTLIFTLFSFVFGSVGNLPAADELPEVPYVYKAVVTKVYDGDTCTADVDLGFDVTFTATLRLEGIDAPEVTGAEKVQGIITRDRVRELVLGQEVRITSHKREKYGRWLASITFILDGQIKDLSAYLIEQKLAEPYK